MKNFTLLAFVMIFLSACVKEDLTPLISESPDGITRLYVKVTFSNCDDSGQNCCNTEYVPVSDAEVYLYGDVDETAEVKFPLIEGKSNSAGIVKFENLENSEYDLEVKSLHGIIKQKVFIQEGKTTRIETRY